MTRYLAVIEYDGSGFCGSQVQAGQRSVQGEVEAAVSRLNGSPTSITLAGRTDSGVHARGQVAGLDLVRSMTGAELASAMNGLMARDVSVRESVPVPEGFHPRYWARARRYVYRVLARRQRDAYRDRFVWHLPRLLDVAAMSVAAAALVGRHDFGAFGRPPQGDSTWRTIQRLEVTARDDEVWFTIEADAFLRHMVRIMVGTLVDVGRGRLSAVDVADMRERVAGRGVGAAAPAKGLALAAVAYERERLGYGVGSWWSCEPLAGAG